MPWILVIVLGVSFLFTLVRFWILLSAVEKERDAALRHYARLKMDLADRQLHTKENCEKMKSALRVIAYDMAYCQRGCPNNNECHYQAIIQAEKTASEALREINNVNKT